MSDLRPFLEAVLTGQPLPPLDGADPNWRGIDPASPEWQDALAADPFLSFPIHPLPPNVQAFIDAHPDLDGRERDAISDLLEQLYHLDTARFAVIHDGLNPEYQVVRR